MADGLFLINLDDGNVWQFQYFPSRINKDDRTNWNPKDVTIGTKPLMYANRDPQRITIDDVLLDYLSSDENVSLTQAIDDLRSLMSASGQLRAGRSAGAPPRLRIVCGAFQKTVVLEELRVVEEQYSRDTHQLLRARLSLTLIEFVQIERVTSRVRDIEDDIPESGVIGQTVR